MIKSFKCKNTARIFNRIHTGRFPAEIHRIALRKLRMMNRAADLNDLKVPPGNRLEKLRGGRAGQMSIRINDQWRIYFVWKDGDCFDVEIVDYH